jgi:two-component system, NtrC family, sensor kinase
VFAAVLRSAARLCDAFDATILQVDGDELRIVAHEGPIPTIPLLRGAEAIGAIGIRRTEVRPFTDRQIELLQIFAAQAVIAIENVRPFNETKEALEHQTATAEILGIISSSPTDVQPVFEAIVQSAVRLGEAVNGGVFRFDGSLIHEAATYRMSSQHLDALRSVWPRPADRGTTTGCAILTRAVVHVDIAEDPEYAQSALVQAGFRMVLSVPMLRDGDPIGAISIARDEGRPFSDTQIALLQTFADQAVIAIENVRLFNETKEALEQQTATAEILRVISSSPTDLQPVMEAVVENAARVCGASDSSITLLEGERLRVVTHHGSLPRTLAIGDTIPATRGTTAGRAVLDPRTIHVEDIVAAEVGSGGGGLARGLTRRPAPRDQSATMPRRRDI